MDSIGIRRYCSGHGDKAIHWRVGLSLIRWLKDSKSIAFFLKGCQPVKKVLRILFTVQDALWNQLKSTHNLCIHAFLLCIDFHYLCRLLDTKKAFLMLESQHFGYKTLQKVHDEDFSPKALSAQRPFCPSIPLKLSCYMCVYVHVIQPNMLWIKYMQYIYIHTCNIYIRSLRKN